MALVSEQSTSGGGGFISISSSEDEASTPKRKRSPKRGSISGNEIADEMAPTSRAKRARVSSIVGSIPDEKVSEEGEINENEPASDGAQGQERDENDAENDVENDEEKETGATSRAFVPQDPPLFVQGSLLFKLPVFPQKREGSWITRFKDWTQAFHSSNKEHAATLTPRLVHTAFRQYIDCHSGLRTGKRRDAKSTSANMEATGALAEFVEGLKLSGAPQQNEAQAGAASSPRPSTGSAPVNQVLSDGVSNAPSEKLLTTVNSAATVPGVDQQLPSSADAAPSITPSQSNDDLGDSAAAHKQGIPTGEDALMQQRRYFPAASDPADMCLLCGKEGHVATECQDSSCKFCSRDDHWDFACPTIPTRCGKCFQLGHSSGRCIEKLSLTKDEGLVCFYCNSPDHIENECTEVWRSYAPLAHAVKTVSFLPTSCAICGSARHFSGDCPSRRLGGTNPTWSLRNRNLYIDPLCTSTAIEESFSEVGKPKPSRQTDLRIRGLAPRTHVEYESEDSDVEFLGQRSNVRKANIGQIRVSSNIQMPNERHLPPLPQGPPPPSLPRIPPLSRPSLPSRPPPHNYQHVPPPPPLTSNSRSGFGGGRGGSHGRGGRGGRGGRARVRGSGK